MHKITNSMNVTMARRAIHWIAAARRPLKLEELQEGVAFDLDDRTWNPEKIPNGDRLLQSCHGLIIRDAISKVRFAHTTVLQYFLVHRRPNRTLEEYQGRDPGDLYISINEAQITIAEVCAAYLCFSDFESALIPTQKERRLTVNTGEWVRSGQPHDQTCIRHPILPSSRNTLVFRPLSGSESSLR